MRQQPRRSIESVETSLEIIEHLVQRGPSRLSDIAEAVERSPSTTHVHLQTLRENEFVLQHDDRYRLGLNFLRVGGRLRQRLKIFRAGKNEIDDLADELNQAAHLALEQSGLRVIVYKADPGDAVHDNTPTGEFSHMHWTASGKAILANLDERDIREIIDEWGLPHGTQSTLTDQDALIDHLREVREQGYALDNEERCQGVVGVGVPIYEGRENTAVGAISASGPRERMLNSDGSIREEILTEVQDCANVIELRYNHYSPADQAVGEGEHTFPLLQYSLEEYMRLNE